MTVTLPTHAWQLLRAMVRAGGCAPAEDLHRVAGGVRRQKREQLFARLVTAGLAERVEAGGTFYKLTERGTHAAEYGEYEAPWEEVKAAHAAANGGTP